MFRLRWRYFWKPVITIAKYCAEKLFYPLLWRNRTIYRSTDFHGYHGRFHRSGNKESKVSIRRVDAFVAFYTYCCFEILSRNMLPMLQIWHPRFDFQYCNLFVVLSCNKNLFCVTQTFHDIKIFYRIRKNISMTWTLPFLQLDSFSGSLG